jgi:tetratricopeptide (TPR) repeat protein
MRGSLGRTYRWAGYAREASAEYSEAIRLARQQLETNSQDAEIRAYLALFLAETGDRVMAVREMREALALAPSNVNVLFFAVWVYETVGDRAAALNTLRAIVHIGPLMEEIRRRPELEALRSDSTYTDLVNGSGPEQGIRMPKGG